MATPQRGQGQFAQLCADRYVPACHIGNPLTLHGVKNKKKKKKKKKKKNNGAQFEWEEAQSY